MHHTGTVAGLPTVTGRVGPFEVDRTRVARVGLGRGDLWVRPDAIMGHTGTVATVPDGQLELRLRQAFLDPAARLERLQGTGDVLVSAGPHDLQLVHVSNHAATVNAAHLIGFTGDLDVSAGLVRRTTMRGSDLATTTLRGTGTVAVAAHGPPVALTVRGEPVTVAGAAVAWWAGDLRAEPAPLAQALARDGVAFRGSGTVVLHALGRSDPLV